MALPVDIAAAADTWLATVTDDQLAKLIAQQQQRRAEIDARIGFLLSVQNLRAIAAAMAAPSPPATTTP
jgi:hypothetical protein